MSAEYDGLVAQAKSNNDLLDSITTFLNGVAARILQGVADATELAGLKASMTTLATEMKSKDDVAAAALVSATPAAAPVVTPPGPEPIAPPAP
jgi:hypothetical protein